MVKKVQLTPVDHDALRRAWDEACRDPMRAEQLARIETATGRRDAQMQAAYHCQRKNLKLPPWEDVPMHGDLVVPFNRGDPFSRAKAKALLDRLLAAGLSRYEPDPLGEPPRAA
jgi:hypothetical protein